MTILVLDTAASVCAAALYNCDNGQIMAEVSHDIGKGHAEVLLDYVAQCVAMAGIDRKTIKRVVVNIGPGSFTGVRVGVSAARGFGLALNCPVIGVTGFAALASEAQWQHSAQKVMIALSAYRGDIYAQGFDSDGQAVTTPLAGSAEEICAVLQNLGPDFALSGSAAQQLQDHEGQGRLVLGTNANAAMISFARLGADCAAGDPPEPLYMRGPDVKPQTGFALARQAETTESGTA